MNGNLVVSGACVLTGVTVTGHVTVLSGGGLGLESSSVRGSISVNSGGELDIDHSLGGHTATSNSSSVGGAISIINGADLDVWNAAIGGSIFINGIPVATGNPRLCNDHIGGSVTVENDTGSSLVGDPNNSSAGRPCTGNRIGGSLTIRSNAGLAHADSNTIVGSLSARNNTGGGEINNDTVGGSVTCASNSPPYTSTGTVAGGMNGAAGGTC